MAHYHLGREGGGGTFTFLSSSLVVKLKHCYGHQPSRPLPPRHLPCQSMLIQVCRRYKLMGGLPALPVVLLDANWCADSRSQASTPPATCHRANQAHQARISTLHSPLLPFKRLGR